MREIKIFKLGNGKYFQSQVVNWKMAEEEREEQGQQEQEKQEKQEKQEQQEQQEQEQIEEKEQEQEVNGNKLIRPQEQACNQKSDNIGTQPIKHETKINEVINDYYEFITPEESDKRLILLGSIFALCLLTLATAFVAITIKLFFRFKIPVVLNYTAEPREISGFPYPAVLLILNSGTITEFSTISSSHCCFRIFQRQRISTF